MAIQTLRQQYLLSCASIILRFAAKLADGDRAAEVAVAPIGVLVVIRSVASSVVKTPLLYENLIEQAARLTALSSRLIS